MSEAATQQEDHAEKLRQALKAMSNDLLIVLVKRIGGPLRIPVSEIDSVEGLGLSMKVVGDGDAFEFEVIEPVAALPRDFVDVESSSMTKARYDNTNLSLHIVFKNGQHWRYLDVPTGTAHDFFQSDSKGSFFGKHIRGKFTEERCVD